MLYPKRVLQSPGTMISISSLETLQNPRTGSATQHVHPFLHHSLGLKCKLQVAANPDLYLAVNINIDSLLQLQSVLKQVQKALESSRPTNSQTAIIPNTVNASADRSVFTLTNRVFWSDLWYSSASILRRDDKLHFPITTRILSSICNPQSLIWRHSRYLVSET